MRQAAVEMRGRRTTSIPSRPRRAMLIGMAWLLASSFVGAWDSAAGKATSAANPHLAKSIRLNPRLLGAHLNLGGVYALEGKMEEAEKVYRKALELDPDNPSARFVLAKAESALGRFAASLEVSRPS